MFVVLAVASSVFAEEEVEKKTEKRGVLGLGLGYPTSLGYTSGLYTGSYLGGSYLGGSSYYGGYPYSAGYLGGYPYRSGFGGYYGGYPGYLGAGYNSFGYGHGLYH